MSAAKKIPVVTDEAKQEAAKAISNLAEKLAIATECVQTPDDVYKVGSSGKTVDVLKHVGKPEEEGEEEFDEEY